MRKKIAGLVLTGFILAIVTYAASNVRNEASPSLEVVEVSEMGLQSTEIINDKLNKLIKEYEVISPEETPWQTCQQ
jgi:hypothetical protein